MFEFGRELRRWLGGQGAAAPLQDGLTGGDGALLELLEIDLLYAEGKAADVAAGRISARDRPQRQLEAAFTVWRLEAAHRRMPATRPACARPRPMRKRPPLVSVARAGLGAGPARAANRPWRP